MSGLLRPSAPAPVDVSDLIVALDAISIARPAAIAVLSVIDDPNADAPRVAAAVEKDPAFAAQVMRLANSAFYGMSGRVSSTGFAVTVIGFSATRSLAAVTATGLANGDRPKPPGFWFHAAAAAAACSIVAPRHGLPKGDAFAAGLLHDLGLALLHGFDTTTHQHLLDTYGVDGSALSHAEQETFGMGHDAAAARVLAAWRFPEPLREAIADHHSYTASEAIGPFAKTIRAGDLLADLAAAHLEERKANAALDRARSGHHADEEWADEKWADGETANIKIDDHDDAGALACDPELDAKRDELVEALGESGLDEMIEETAGRAAEIMASLTVN